MGDFKEQHGKTRVGMLIQNVAKFAPEVLDLASNIPGLQVLDKAADIVRGKKLPEQTEAAILADIEREKAVEIARLQDIDSARRREVEIAKTGRSDWMKNVVGIFVMILVSSVCYAVFFMKLENSELAHFIAGEIVGFGASLVFYYFGSSKSSSDKDKALRS